MFQFFKTTPQLARLQTLACLTLASGTVFAQDFSMRVADPNPLGIGNFVPTNLNLAEASGAGMGMKGTFFYGLGVQTAYDSNFTLAEENEEDELSILFQPTFRYTSDPEGGANFALTANYQPTYNAYLNNSDLSKLDNSADVSLSWRGGLTDIATFASYQQLSGTDRLTGGFTTGAVFSGGVRINREIAPRTSLNGALSYSQSEYSTEEDEGTQAFTGSFGGLWMATQRTSIGSSIRFTQTESNNTGTRQAWAPHFELRYQAAQRIWLSASLGPEFTQDSESSDNDVAMSASIQASYMINERWSWSNSFRTGTVASPSDTGYLVNNYSFSTSLNHQLNRGNISSGLSFDYSVYESVADVLAERDNEENMSIFLAYSRDLWSERLMFNSSVRYRVNSGDREWSQWSLSSGLNIRF